MYIICTCIYIQMQPGPVEEVYIATILREILKGLEYLHTEGKLHRDIKGMTIVNYRYMYISYYTNTVLMMIT